MDEIKPSTSNGSAKSLKCSNCGSSNFIQSSYEVFKCAYCGSTVQLTNDLRDKFISNIDVAGKSNDTLHLIQATKSEEDFIKESLISLGMNPDTPDDVLQAAFGEVKTNYSYYLALEVEYNVIKISSKAEPSTLRQEETLADPEQSSSYLTCVKVPEKEVTPLSRVLMEDLEAIDKKFVTTSLTKTKAKELKLHIPDRQIIDEAIDERVEHIKQSVFGKVKNSNITIVPTIKKIDLYIAPEYSVDYEYQGKTYTIRSFAYDIRSEEDQPVAKKALSKRVKKTSLSCALTSMAMSTIAIIFALVHLCVLKTKNFLPIDATLIVLSLIVFAITKIINKIVIVKLKKNTFEKKRKQVFAHFAQNKALPQLTNIDKATADNCVRWY